MAYNILSLSQNINHSNFFIESEHSQVLLGIHNFLLDAPITGTLRNSAPKKLIYRGCLGLLHKLCSTNSTVEQLYKN